MKINYNERNCDICGDLYKHDSRQKSKYCSSICRTFAFNQRKIKGEENIDFVICKICGFKFKEINNDHLENHKISCDEYDKVFNSSRTSEKTRKNKNTLSSLMSEELSKKLSQSHTIENYITKYGEIDGKNRFNLMMERKKYRNGKQSYLDRFGDDGELIFKEVQKKKKITLENLITKYGEEEGKRRYDDYRYKKKVKNLLSTYIEKYGYDDGLVRWLDKNNKISISNSKIKREDRDKFKDYIYQVNKFTRISIEMNILENLELRGQERGFDLDHVVSKVNGFKQGIPPYIIGHISNLKIVESTYNRKKQHRSDMPVEKIIEQFENDTKYKKLIFDLIDIENGNNRK
jgi:hypothetical protein